MRAAAEDWPALLHRCEELGIKARDLDLEHESVEAALAAIDAANKSVAWKKGHRKKLRVRLQRAIAAAEAMAVDDHGDEEAAAAAAVWSASTLAWSPVRRLRCLICACAFCSRSCSN